MGAWLLVASLACSPAGGTPSAASSPALSSQASASSSPPVPPGTILPLTAEVVGRASPQIFLGGDDHVGFSIHNIGRDIEDIAIDFSAGDRWLDHHSIAMGTTAGCNVDSGAARVHCGPIRSGASTSIILRATPDDEGEFTYLARFFDGPDPVRDARGGEVAVQFREKVLPIPRWEGGGGASPTPGS